MKMENLQTRNLKVYNQGQGYRGNVPTIILKGDWLKKFGFDCDKPIEVICEKDKLVISIAAS